MISATSDKVLLLENPSLHNKTFLQWKLSHIILDWIHSCKFIHYFTAHLLKKSKLANILSTQYFMLLCPGTVLLESFLITTLFKRALSREQNTWRNNKEKNTGLRKSKSFTEFRYMAIFVEGNRDPTPPGGSIW